MLLYDACNWYWQRENGKVFSSARQREVLANDATYQQWLAAGGVPKPYPKDTQGNECREEMKKILYVYGLRVYPLTDEEAAHDVGAERAGCQTRYALREQYERELEEERRRARQ